MEKVITVRDLLQLMDEGERVCVYGDLFNSDGLHLKTAGDILNAGGAIVLDSSVQKVYRSVFDRIMIVF